MLPQLNSKSDNISMINAFLGLNRTQTVAEAEFSETMNITNDYYPVLGNRKKRFVMNSLTNCKAMIGGEVIAYVAQNTDGSYALFYNDDYVCDVSGAENTVLIMMGAYICVFPDGIIYNTSTGEKESIVNEVVTSGTVSFDASTSEGADYENIIVSSTAPSSPSDGTYWNDTSTTPHVLKVYSATYSAWQSVATAYTTISATGIGKGFNVYDAVSIDGIVSDTSFNTSSSGAYYIIYAKTDNSITIAGTLEADSQTAALTVKRVKPDIDFICELDNRLWACSATGHEIYACKQGDPRNWYCYAGLVSDSYAVSVGTQGEFTGCAAYGGYIYFFKENGYHKIYGTKPSNYEVVFKQARGCQLGSDKSIAHVGDYLFWKSKDAVVMYDGSVNVISEKLGSEKYFDAIGAGYRDKYYLCMRDNEYTYYLFVYDITKGTWIMEDNLRVLFMAETNKNGMYICNYPVSGVSKIWTVNDKQLYDTIFPLKIYREDSIYKENQSKILSMLEAGSSIATIASTLGYTESGLTTYINSKCWYPCAGGDSPTYTNWYPGYTSTELSVESDIEWSFTTGDIGMDSPFQKYLKRIILRLFLDTMSNIEVEVMYDDSDYWEKVISYHCTRKRSYEIPIPVRRCDHLKLRFSGNGDFKLYSIAKATEEGSGF